MMRLELHDTRTVASAMHMMAFLYSQAEGRHVSHMAKVGKLANYTTHVRHTWDCLSQKLLQVVTEEQLVAGDLEAWSTEQGTFEAQESFIWQSVFPGSAAFCFHCLRSTRHVS